MSERLEHVSSSGPFVATNTLIYVSIGDRAQFDLIERPMTDHGLKENGHVLSKAVEGDGVYIVFQHWLLQRTYAALIADMTAERERRAVQPFCGDSSTVERQVFPPGDAVSNPHPAPPSSESEAPR